ncbi:MAG: PSD1 domain-containing protein [Verrucomicrobia bacterium]|nr:PSD1 domain-containing protein [Verrucomicrobiota bacterium]
MKQSLALRLLLLLSCLSLAQILAARTPNALPDKVQFNRDVRPLLSDRCLACHGPDKNARKGKLRLDLRDEAIKKAIVPGDVASSPLIKHTTSRNPEEVMPPPDSGKKPLSKPEVELLKRWVAQGAPWEAHWAFIKPERPNVPKVSANKTRIVNPIDSFILARLEKEKLKPATEADRRTLIRRLSFDLTGLPPTPEAVRAVAGDKSPKAYEQLVDRLLASPHFGERMAMYWLDVVRYADTDGFHADNYRSVYPYRDYVVDAFNQNLPFDRFTIEQLAGDLLPNATTTQKIASTYNRLNRTTEEGGAQAKEYLAKYAADRVRTTSTAWMAATMGCCECHDHKFDPYSTKDFYSFEAFFADIKEQGVGKPEASLVGNEAQTAELKRFDTLIADLEKTLVTPTAQLDAAQSTWETGTLRDLDAGRLDWLPLKPETLASTNGATLTIQEDLSVLVSGKNPDKDTYTITLRTDREHITAIRLEAMTDPSLDNQSLSRGGGNFVLTGFEVELPGAKDATNQPVKIATAIADYSQKDFPVAAAIDSKRDTGWAVDGGSSTTNHQAAFIFAKPLAGGPDTTLIVRLKHESKFKHHNIGRFRLALISLRNPVLTVSGLSDETIDTLRKPKDDRSAEQAEALSKYYLNIAPELDSVREELISTKKQKEEFRETVPTSLVTVAVEPREMRVLPRGNWMSDAGDVVTPAVPHFLAHSENKTERLTRLDLARWLISRDNPLTARVFVNRLWKLYFGTGISKTLDDFGAQGEWPQHPQLLDWLAVEFMDSGWDIKHMIKLMVMSSTYRQSSDADEKLRERDPFNRLLSRQSRFRLDAEMVRDNALAVSGLLADNVGGPSVKPYQPAGYWDQLNFPKRTYTNDHGASEYRRGLYTFWCRTFVHPSLVAFDAATREECTVERITSNTPLQALVLLNDPTYVEAARVFAARIITNGGKSVDDRLDWTFDHTLDRRPRPEEKRKLSELYRKQLDRYAADKDSAEKLVSVGEWPANKELNVAELAAWTSIARVMLNLNETIARY